jgi:hypothetical protein
MSVYLLFNESKSFASNAIANIGCLKSFTQEVMLSRIMLNQREDCLIQKTIPKIPKAIVNNENIINITQAANHKQYSNIVFN